MLAKIDWSSAPCDPVADIDYTGFPLWHVLLTQPNREQRSADCLKYLNIQVYLPHYKKQCRSARPTHFHARICPMISCMLFVPTEMMEVDNRDRIMDWADVRFAKRQLARPLTKKDIEDLRAMEAHLNIRAPEKAEDCELGQRVRLRNGLLTAFLGVGTIIEVATGGRIRIEMEQKLLGGKSIVWVSSADVEVMQPETAA